MEHNFTNVTFYRTSDMFGNILRTDAKTLKITENVKYAQYDDAIRVEFIPAGTRNGREFVLTYEPFLVVVRRAEAIEPEDMCGVVCESRTPGVTVSKSRYRCFDPRWETDFLDSLKANGVSPVFMIGAAETIERSL